MPACELTAARAEIAKLRRVLSKKTLENEILKETVEHAAEKLACALALVVRDDQRRPSARRSGWRARTSCAAQPAGLVGWIEERERITAGGVDDNDPHLALRSEDLHPPCSLAADISALDRKHAPARDALRHGGCLVAGDVGKGRQHRAEDQRAEDEPEQLHTYRPTGSTETRTGM